MKKRMLAMLLVIVLAMSMLPVHALAAATDRLIVRGPKNVRVGSKVTLTALLGDESAPRDTVNWFNIDDADTILKPTGKNTCEVELTTTGTVQVCAIVEEKIQIHTFNVSPAKTDATEPAPEETTPATTAPVQIDPPATEPEATVPETTAPEATVPETTAPETTEPEATVPETTTPDSNGTGVVLDIPADIMAGAKLTLKAHLVQDGKTVPGAQITWSFAETMYSRFATLEGNVLSVPSDQVKCRIVLKAVAKVGGSKVAETDITFNVTPLAESLELYIGTKNVTDETVTYSVNSGMTPITITPAVTPAEADHQVKWQVIDKGLATHEYAADGSLIIKPLGVAGTVSVEAVTQDATNLTASTEIRFVELAEDLYFSAPEMLRGGQSLDLGSALKFSNDPDDSSVVWQVTDENGNSTEYASVTEDGVLKTQVVTEPKTIKVSVQNVIGNFEKTIVLYPVPRAIKLLNGPATPKFEFNPNRTTYRLDATLEPASLNNLVKQGLLELEWSSSDPDVASVDANGVLQIKDAGSVRIDCKIKDDSTAIGSMTLTITKASNGDIHIIAPKTELTAGEYMDLTAEVMSKSGVMASNQGVIWSVTDVNGDATSAATITSGGRLNTYEIENTTEVIVTATSKENPNLTDDVIITIKPVAEKTLHIYVNNKLVEDKTTIVSGESYLVDVMWINTAAGIEIPAKDYLMASNNTGIVSIVDGGLIYANESGTAVITVTCEDKATGNVSIEAIEVEVVEEELKVNSIVIESDEDYVRSGESCSFYATAYTDEARGIEAENQEFTWKVYTRGIFGIKMPVSYASIDEEGVLTAGTVKERKTVEISATSKENGASQIVNFTICPAEDEWLRIEGADENGILLIDNFTKKTYISPVVKFVYPEFVNKVYVGYGETDVSTKVSWSSSDEEVVFITDSNKVKLMGTGSCILEGEYEKDDESYYVSVEVVVTRNMKGFQLRQGGILVSRGEMQMTAVKIDGANNINVDWTVSDLTPGRNGVFPVRNGLVKIDSNGVLKAKKIDSQCEVLVTAKSVDGYGVQYSKVTVYPETTEVVISHNGVEMSDLQQVRYELKQKNAVFNAAAKHDATYDAYNGGFYWTSSDKNVAEVDQNGVVTFKTTGNVIIKATALDGTMEYARVRLTVTR